MVEQNPDLDVELCFHWEKGRVMAWIWFHKPLVLGLLKKKKKKVVLFLAYLPCHFLNWLCYIFTADFYSFFLKIYISFPYWITYFVLWEVQSL